MINNLIELVNSFGDRWMSWAINSLLDASILLVAISSVWFVIRRRVAPQVGYCLFLLIPLKLVLPIQVTVPSTVGGWVPSYHLSARFESGPAIANPETSPAVTGINFDRNTDRPAAKMTPTQDDLTVAPALTNSGFAASDLDDQQLDDHAARNAEAASVAIVKPSSKVSSLRVPAIIMCAWGIVVAFLLCRFVVTQRRFQWRLSQHPIACASSLGCDLNELRRRVGVSCPVRIVFSDDVTAPSVWGITRPTIILPHSIAASHSAEQLEWVLLHELAHIQRRDLFVVAVQRLISMFYFFNPAIWIANRMVHRLREYACDDLAIATSRGSTVDSAEAFMLILRQANRAKLRFDGALGIFGFGSRSASFERVRRLLDTERPIHRRLGWLSCCGVLLAAIIALPRLNAENPANTAKPAAKVDQPDKQQRTDKSNGSDRVAAPTDGVLAKDAGEFDLLVVGPDGKPIPEASVFIEMTPLPTAERFRQGKFDRNGNGYGVWAKANEAGRIVMTVPANPGRVEVRVQMAGYGPYSTAWSSENPSQQLPAKFTVELEQGWAVGGVVVDANAKPVVGASIRPSIQFKKRIGDTFDLHIGTTINTDADGKWKFDGVPISMGAVSIEIDHPEFMSTTISLMAGEYRLNRGGEPVTRLVLDRGITVVGTVHDEDGLPISGAKIRTKYFNSIRGTSTRDDGSYRLPGCNPAMSRIVVSAKGKATDMQQLRIGPEMKPVNFVMKPGGRIRVRVLDENDNPAPKARIFFQQWRSGLFKYFEFDHVNQYADENGVWEWNEAPLDEILADICPPNGTVLSRQPLVAREEEYVFSTSKALTIVGRVIDAETKKPIRKFDLIPGFHNENDHMSWHHKGRFTATNGTYSFKPEHGRVAYIFRIESSGYRAAMSRDVNLDEGRVRIDFELQKANDIAATIVSPDGTPAAGARIALGIIGTQINLLNGDIRDDATYCAVETADNQGEFRIAAQEIPFQLVIVHPKGFAHLQMTPNEEIQPQIKLESWASVEGIFRVGDKPIAGASLSIMGVGPHSNGRKAAKIFTMYGVVTDLEGRYMFDRVYPGYGRIGREIVMMVE